MTETYDKLNHWYGWNGGECPVHPETIIDGTERGLYWEKACAKELHWPSFHGAFRIIKLHVEPKVIWVNEHDERGFAYSSESIAIMNAGRDALRIAVRYVEQPL